MTLLPKLQLYNNSDHDSITKASNYTITVTLLPKLHTTITDHTPKLQTIQ